MRRNHLAKLGTALAFALAAGLSTAANAQTEISFLTGSAPGTGTNYMMQKLVDDYPAGATLEMEQLDNTMDQRIQLLASQDQLPTFFQLGTPSQLIDLHKGGFVADLEPILTELGVLDRLTPLAISVVKGLYGGHLVGLPVELAIEGFFYNKAIFAEHGIEPPATWDDLAAVSEKLTAAGIQPMATAGKDGWPVTRLVAAYLHRDVGPDALRAVADGQAKFTDPEYVKAAEVVADFAAKGYFGEAPAALDYGSAQDLFLQGRAAMFYMGSWALQDLSDPSKNTVGAENVGWFPIPAVEGGKGDVGQTPANVGLPMAVNAKTLTPEVKAFLKYFVENYGTVAMTDISRITGFRTDAEPSNPLVGQTVEIIANLTSFVPWFEALQGGRGTNASQSGGAALIAGQLTGQQFMEQVQAAQ